MIAGVFQTRNLKNKNKHKYEGRFVQLFYSKLVLNKIIHMKYVQVEVKKKNTISEKKTVQKYKEKKKRCNNNRGVMTAGLFPEDPPIY